MNIIRQAFGALDQDKSGHLDLNEVKSMFNPSRHPDVVNGTRSVEEVRQEFLDMFTTHYNISSGFSEEQFVNLEQFIDYHRYVSAFIESDKQFKTYMSGVWNMDLVDTDLQVIGGVQVTPGGIHPALYGKNSREQWKYDMHRSFFGNMNQTPLKQQIQEVNLGYRRATNKAPITSEMPAAGVKTWVQVDKAATVRANNSDFPIHQSQLNPSLQKTD